MGYSKQPFREILHYGIIRFSSNVIGSIYNYPVKNKKNPLVQMRKVQFSNIFLSERVLKW